MGNQTVCALKFTQPPKDLPRVSTLLHDIRTVAPNGTFLGDVLQAVLDADDNFYRDFFVDDNHLLCFRRSENMVAQVCVPSQCKGAVLRATHGDSLLAGLPEIDRTTASIAHYFNCPRLYADLEHCIRPCPTCAELTQKKKLKGRNHQRFEIPQFSTMPVQPFTSWAMDMIGPLPTTELGNNWIVTWVNRTTKTIVTEWPRLLPLHPKRRWHFLLFEKYVVALDCHWNWLWTMMCGLTTGYEKSL